MADHDEGISVQDPSQIWRATVITDAIDAGKIGELLGVVAEVDLVIGLVKRAESREQLALVVALEARSWHDVEQAIGAVAVGGGITAALGFEVVDILRVDLRPDIAGDI